MRHQYEFSNGKRGAVIPASGKTRMTIYLDDQVLQRLRSQSEKSGKGCQTLINEALKAYTGLTEKPLTPEIIRKIVRGELAGRQ
jgi:uncharacterized protein (DUF4415 family)